MPAKINLLKSRKRKNAQTPREKKLVISSSLLLLMVLLIAGSGFYAYKLILAKEVKLLEGQIAQQEDVIDSYKEIEERKGLLTLKTNEIQAIYENKFDYLKAVNDAQELFGFSIEISSIDIEKEGSVSVVSRKVSDITLSQEQAFSTNISDLNLTITVPNSKELEETIDTVLGFQGQGLSSVIVTSTQLLETGEYEVQFAITFESTKPA